MNIYDFTAKKPNGDIVSMQTYKDKVMLVVNTALHCDFTYQYDDLQRLYAKYKDRQFTVVSFPCNQFANQNPEDGETTAKTCRTSFGVQFPIYEAIDVNGKQAHPLFLYLKNAVDVKSIDKASMQEKMLYAKLQDLYPENFIGNNIRWNFTKFLVNAQGEVIKRFEPTDSIVDIEEAIEQLLA